MALNKYDELGQLKEKILAPTGGPGSGILETQKYEYNVRGWLLGMNRDYVKAGATGSYFGFDLAYDKTNNSNYSGTTPTNTNLNSYAGTGMFNGNITGMTWRGSNSTKEIRRYDFTYDAANRLLKADFGQLNGGIYAPTAAMDYSVKMGNGIDPLQAYDYNGNILKMVQRGVYNNAALTVDSLVYSYNISSNKLKSVSEKAISTTAYGLGDFNDGVNGATDDYAYDVNGNLTNDQNKKITGITYNFLNLPEQIKVLGKGIITYQYDATGNKLSKTTTDSTVTPVKTTTTQYVGGMIFENDALQFVSTEEGRARLNGSTWVFDYMLKDHLGNVRATVAEGGTLLEESAYYPFGLIQKGISYQNNTVLENKKKYNGIDWENDLGIAVYDANFRELDPQMGRWWEIDPMIENMEHWSPYASNYDNPVTYTDPLGNEPEDYDGGGDDPPKRSFWQGVKDGAVNFAKAIAKPPIVTLYEVGSEAVNGNFKPAVSLLVPAISKTDDAVDFYNGDAQTRGRIFTENALEFGAAFAGDKIFKFGGKSPEIKTQVKPEVKIEKPYQRPNNATTKQQRASVQNKPCVNCGVTAKKMVAGHKKALVREYYETGKIDKKKMRSTDAVRPECPTCSAKEGAEMSKYSKEQKKQHGL